VTGASGYIAMHIIYQLLEKGHNVHGTVRSLKDESKINELKNALTPKGDKVGKLELFEADLLEKGSYKKCFENCSVVLHTASPFQIVVEDPERDLVKPAVLGTENVINECLANKDIKRVVVTSSMISVCGPKDEGYTYKETDWNNPKDFGYAYSKVYAEKKAWELVEGKDIELVVCNPAFVLGPPLSSRTDSTSIKVIKGLLEGATKEVQKK